MAFPVISILNSSGSDTAASGAGPATAKTGTAATSTSTTNIDITDTVDLSGVSTAGDAVIYWIDTTAGHRRFARITNVTGGPSGSTWHITLDANSPVTSGVGPISWAIGGVRASLTSATSILLVSNNSAAGDAMPGWVIEFQSGHVESATSTIDTRRPGDTTTGPIIIRGAAGAATRPLVTNNQNANCFVIRGINQQFRAFEVQNTNATKTVSNAFINTNATSSGILVEDIKCKDSTNKFFQFYSENGGQGGRIISCEIGNTAGSAIIGTTGSIGGLQVLNNWIYNCGSHAVNFASGTYFSCTVRGNIIYNTTGSGILYANTRTDSLGGCTIEENTIDLSSSDNIQVTQAAVSLSNLEIINNCLTNSSGGYGLNFNNASLTDAYIQGNAPTIKGNNTFNNSSGAYHSNTAAYTASNCPWASGDPGLNPTYNAASTGDFTITNASLKAQAYPLGGTLHVGTGSTTYSYPTPGAAQPNPTGGGSAGMLYVPNLDGV